MSNSANSSFSSLTKALSWEVSVRLWSLCYRASFVGNSAAISSSNGYSRSSSCLKSLGCSLSSLRQRSLLYSMTAVISLMRDSKKAVTLYFSSSMCFWNCSVILL
jgi:hypothetical protein